MVNKNTSLKKDQIRQKFTPSSCLFPWNSLVNFLQKEFVGVEISCMNFCQPGEIYDTKRRHHRNGDLLSLFLNCRQNSLKNAHNDMPPMFIPFPVSCPNSQIERNSGEWREISGEWPTMLTLATLVSQVRKAGGVLRRSIRSKS